MTTFEVGDKVTALGKAEGTISYGPFSSTFDRHVMYVVKHDDGNEKSYQETDLTALPAFTVGDTVETNAGITGKLVAGPYVSNYAGETFWVLERVADGKHTTPLERTITKVAADATINVGDKVRVTEAGHRGASVKVGDVFTVYMVKKDYYGGDVDEIVVTPGGGVNGRWYLDSTAVEKVSDAATLPDTYTHDGVTYDLRAEYRDNEGDLWQFNSGRVSGPDTLDGNEDGTPLGRWRMPAGNFDCHEWTWSLAEVARKLGTLTRVND